MTPIEPCDRMCEAEHGLCEHAVAILTHVEDLAWPRRLQIWAKDWTKTKVFEHLAQNVKEAATPEMLLRLPGSTLAKLLRDDQLGVVHEDEVFDLLSFFTHRKPEGRARGLWQTCRLGALSPSRALQAAELSAIPRGAAEWARLYFGKTQHPVHSWVEHRSLRPRSSLCAARCTILMASPPEESGSSWDDSNQGEQFRRELLHCVAAELRRLDTFHVKIVYADFKDSTVELEDRYSELVLAAPLLQPRLYEDGSSNRCPSGFGFNDGEGKPSS